MLDMLFFCRFTLSCVQNESLLSIYVNDFFLRFFLQLQIIQQMNQARYMPPKPIWDSQMSMYLIIENIHLRPL